MDLKQLTDRAIVRLSPQDPQEDVRAFLQGLVTNDVSGDLPVYAALLSAQGKCLCDFFVWDGGEGSLLIDCQAEAADDLVKRLSLYRLRRRIEIVRDEALAAWWNFEPFDGGMPDPRLPELGFRAVMKAVGLTGGLALYHNTRLLHGVPEGKVEMGDILWLETNAVELNGVNFTKGCYVGQENTARMNWRQKINRRLVVVPLDQSNLQRQRVAYPEFGLAVDHLRVSEIDPATQPEWLRAAIAD